MAATTNTPESVVARGLVQLAKSRLPFRSSPSVRRKARELAEPVVRAIYNRQEGRIEASDFDPGKLREVVCASWKSVYGEDEGMTVGVFGGIRSSLVAAATDLVAWISQQR